MTASEATVRQAYLAHRRKHGVAATIKIVRSVIPSEDLESASEAELDELLEKLGEKGDSAGPSDFVTESGTLDAAAIYAKWNATGHKRG